MKANDGEGFEERNALYFLCTSFPTLFHSPEPLVRCCTHRVLYKCVLTRWINALGGYILGKAKTFPNGRAFLLFLQRPALRHPEHLKKVCYNLKTEGRFSGMTRSLGTTPPQPTALILDLRLSSVGSHVELGNCNFKKQQPPPLPISLAWS